MRYGENSFEGATVRVCAEETPVDQTSLQAIDSNKWNDLHSCSDHTCELDIVIWGVAYLCLTVVMDVLYTVDAYQDEMNSGFCKLDQRVMNEYNDYYSTTWCSVYAYIEWLYE